MGGCPGDRDGAHSSAASLVAGTSGDALSASSSVAACGLLHSLSPGAGNLKSV